MQQYEEVSAEGAEAAPGAAGEAAPGGGPTGGSSQLAVAQNGVGGTNAGTVADSRQDSDDEDDYDGEVCDTLLFSIHSTYYRKK